MKKIMTFLLLGLSIGLVAQDFRSLSMQEIRECKSPEAVSWNFVVSVLLNQYDVMESLSSPELIEELQTMMRKSHFTHYSQLFTEQYFQDISGIRPVLIEGYRLVCDSPYYDTMKIGSDEVPICSVHFNCADTNGNMYVGQHDATVRVILLNVNNKWVVRGFK